MLSPCDSLESTINATGKLIGRFFGFCMWKSNMTFADLSEACRISERTLKGYVKEKRLGNFYPFSVAMIAVGGRYEELLKELKGNDFGSMPLFCRTGFARANAFFRKTASNRSWGMRKRYHRVASSVSHQSNDQYHHWANLTQIIATSYDFGIPLGVYMSMVAEKSKEYLLEILSKGKSIADDEFIIMDEKEVDDFIRMEKLRIKMLRNRNVFGNPDLSPSL